MLKLFSLFIVFLGLFGTPLSPIFADDATSDLGGADTPINIGLPPPPPSPSSESGEINTDPNQLQITDRNIREGISRDNQIQYTAVGSEISKTPISTILLYTILGILISWNVILTFIVLRKNNQNS